MSHGEDCYRRSGDVIINRWESVASEMDWRSPWLPLLRFRAELASIHWHMIYKCLLRYVNR